ncbi:MAG: hypothetical protein AAGA09_07530 [Pseudomonadota bacterium]
MSDTGDAQDGAKDGAENSAPTFSRVTMIALVLVGTFTFCAFFVLSAYAPLLREGRDGGAHILSKSAVGYAFLGALLEGSDAPVVAARNVLPEDSAGALVLTPGSFDDLEDLPALWPYRITVIVLPKWRVGEDPDHPGWVRQFGVADLADISLAIGEREYAFGLKRRDDDSEVIVEAANPTGGLITNAVPSRNMGAFKNLQYLQPHDDLEPILTDQDGAVVLAKVKDAPVYLAPDPDFFNTQGLSNVDRAKIAVLFFDYARAGDPLFFDLSLHGIERTRNILRLALEPPFLGATLCALFAAFLLALRASFRFGPAMRPSRPFDTGKAALADNSAALIRMAKREDMFGARYANVVRRRIAKVIRAPRTMKTADLDKLIDRVAAGKSDEPFSTLARNAATAEGAGAFLRAAKRLNQFKKEISRGHQ